MHKHILICGTVGVGKSTLVSKLLEQADRRISGYYTQSTATTPDGYHEIYIHAPSDSENAVCIARCFSREVEVRKEVFENCGVELLRRVRPGDIIVMDEIGFMEEECNLFTSRVLELFDGDIPIIAAVKNSHPESRFLEAVRKHPNADLYTITEENRNILFDEIMRGRGVL